MLIYFKGLWPEDVVVDGEPSLLFYEIEDSSDVVTRTVEIFENGDAIRNSINLAQREGYDARAPEFRSLVHGPFLQEARNFLTRISRNEFDRIWNRAVDKVWP